MFKRITMLIFIIGIIFLIIGIWLTGWNNSRTGKLDLREKAVATSEDYWNNSMVMFRYNTMKLQIVNLESQLEDRDILMQELLIEKLSRKYSEDLIVVLADYIKFMQSLCDANNLIYPALVVEDYEQ